MTSHLTRLAMFTAFAHLTIELCANFLPVVYPALIETMGLTYAQVGLIASVGVAGATISQPVFGVLSDRWKPNRIVVLSIAWIGLLMGLVGFTTDYLLLVGLVGLGAIGSAAFHPAGASLALATIGSRRGAAISIFSVGGNVGAALSPLLVAAGIGWLGARGTIVLLPLAVVVAIVMHRQMDRSSAGPGQRPTAGQDLPHGGWLVGLGLIIVLVMGRSWFQLSFATYLPELIHSQGRSLVYGGQLLSIFLVSIGLGSLIGGPLSDLVGRWQVVAVSLVLLGLGQWFFLTVTGPVQLGLVSLMGVMVGASFPVAIIMAQETWPAAVGLASGLVMGLGWAPGGIGTFLTGYLADRFTLVAGLQSLILPILVSLMSVLVFAWLQLGRRGSEVRPYPDPTQDLKVL
jgi:MFS transporter, FSR family, fosmidomycin resistance protein